MVRQTRVKNKTAHPAAPVMSEASKVKAGIAPAKPRAKRMTKDAMIQELEAWIAQLERPDESHPSKEPLVRVSPFLVRVRCLICPSSLGVEVQEATG